MSKCSPEILYKYRSFDARSISMLANDQIYFASPLDFNDPFDCVAHEHMFETPYPESLELLARLHPDVSPEAITRENTEHLIEAISQHPEVNQIIIEQKKALQELTTKLGVLALSARNDSILMWSHYANYHKGFCIGFKNNFGLHQNCVMEVAYTDTRCNDFVPYYLFSQIMGNEATHAALLKDFLFTKYIDWKYEQEWRILGDKGIAIYPEDSIDRVIFGLKMSNEERNTIQYILRNRKIRFFEAVKSKKHFAVDLRELE